MVDDWSYFQEKSSHASLVSHSHHSLNDFLTTRFCQCLTLSRTRKYNYTIRAFQPMKPTIPSKSTIITLH